MTNLRSKLGHIFVLCLMLSVSYGKSMWGAEAETNVNRLAKAYRAATTEAERRAVCLEAIDAGAVARGRSIADVDAVFGTTYARKLPTGTKLETGVVNFRLSPQSHSDKIASAYVGWYLAFQFDSAGRLQNYYLTNVHK